MRKERISRVIFWEPFDSPHKSDLIRSFAQMNPSWEVLTVVDQPISKDRRALGWVADHGGGYEPLVSPTDEEIARIASGVPEESLHVFSGIRWVPTLVRALRTVRKVGARFAIMSEPRALDGWRGMARVLHSWLTEGFFRRKCSFVLAIGRNGPSWFRLAGYPVDRVFPFAYFIPESPAAARYRLGGKLRIGFVGRFEREKGVFDLVQACSILKVPCELFLIGEGIEEIRLRTECAQYNIDTTFTGVVPIEQVRTLLGGVDVLVAPSLTKDGWCAAVSEALLSGCAVVTTTKVGASIVINDKVLGRVVPPHSPESICAALESIIAEGGFTPCSRKRRLEFARTALTGHAGAAYLMDIIHWTEQGVARPIAFYERPVDGDIDI